SADLLQRLAPDEAHRAREDDRVPVRAGGHRDLEEVAIAVVEAAQVLVVLPVAIVLRCLDECDVGVAFVQTPQNYRDWEDDQYLRDSSAVSGRMRRWGRRNGR